MNDTSVLAVCDLFRLRNEFLSMPGLCLDVRQTARLLSLQEGEARALLEALVDEGLLVLTVDGRYRRVPWLTAFIPPAA